MNLAMVGVLIPQRSTNTRHPPALVVPHTTGCFLLEVTGIQLLDLKNGRKGDFFFWPHCTAGGILVPRPGIEPVPPAVEAWSPNHWTARELPGDSCLGKPNGAFRKMSVCQITEAPSGE